MHIGLTGRHYIETPCEQCGRPASLKGLDKSYHLWRGNRCDGSGGSRIEVISDYDAAASYIADEFDLDKSMVLAHMYDIENRLFRGDQ